MKKIFTLVSSALLASAAWAGVITLDLNKPMNPTVLEFNEHGVWTQCYNDVDYTWMEFGDASGEFMLSHLIDGEGASWGGNYWDGFCPAIGGDQTDYDQPGAAGTWTTNFGGCMAGGGCVINEDGTVSADAAQPYLVAYYSSWAMEGASNQVMFTDKDGNTTFTPAGVYVCNHPWAYYNCLNGGGGARAFAEGDYFELTAHGVAADGTETTASINLVEYVNGQLNALNDWTFFDLSSLGEVESIYFTLNSTDVGAYGMNTAAYFCMDKFQVMTEDEPVEDPHMQGKWLVVIDMFGNHNWFQLTKGANDDYATTVALEYYTYGLYDPDNVADVPFYFVVDGVQYGAEGAMTPAVIGQAMENPLFESEEYYTVPVGYSYALGIAIINNEYYAYVSQAYPTSVDELNAGKTVAGVRYFNMAGQEMQEANGMTIVVTTYTDGTTSAAKVMK